MNEEKWMNDLRHEEDNFMLTLPEGLWDDIKENLPSTEKKHLVFPLRLRYASVAAGIAVLLGAGLYMYNDTDSPVNAPRMATNEPKATPSHDEVLPANEASTNTRVAMCGNRHYNATRTTSAVDDTEVALTQQKSELSADSTN